MTSTTLGSRMVSEESSGQAWTRRHETKAPQFNSNPVAARVAAGVYILIIAALWTAFIWVGSNILNIGRPW